MVPPILSLSTNECNRQMTLDEATARLESVLYRATEAVQNVRVCMYHVFTFSLFIYLYLSLHLLLLPLSLLVASTFSFFFFDIVAPSLAQLLSGSHFVRWIVPRRTLMGYRSVSIKFREFLRFLQFKVGTPERCAGRKQSYSVDKHLIKRQEQRESKCE